MATQKKLFIVLQPVNNCVNNASTIQLVSINSTVGGGIIVAAPAFI